MRAAHSSDQKTHPLFVPGDPLSLGTGGGGDALGAGFLFTGEGDGFFRFPQNGILLFLLLAELEGSKSWVLCGRLILLGEAGSCLGFWRAECDWCPFAPKKSDSPEVLIFVRDPGTTIDIEAARKARDGWCKRKRSYRKTSGNCGEEG
jgi:hypothetical protein